MLFIFQPWRSPGIVSIVLYQLDQSQSLCGFKRKAIDSTSWGRVAILKKSMEDGWGRYNYRAIFGEYNLPQHVTLLLGKKILYACMHAQSLQSCLTLWDPRDYSPLGLLGSWGFSRQEYWSVLPWPLPGDLSNPGIKPASPALQADSLLSHQGSHIR